MPHERRLRRLPSPGLAAQLQAAQAAAADAWLLAWMLQLMRYFSSAAKCAAAPVERLQTCLKYSWACEALHAESGTGAARRR